MEDALNFGSFSGAEVSRDRNCSRILGDFRELFWGVFRAVTLALYIQELLGSFFEEEEKDKSHFENSTEFSVLFSVLFSEKLRI